MKKDPVIRLYAAILLALASLLAPASARAQFQPRPVSDPATGEQFHIEGAIGLWFPGTEMQISSTALAIVGSKIDFKTDLGLQDQKFPEFHLVAKGGKHKFRLQYIPLNYAAGARRFTGRSSSTARRTRSACRSTPRWTGKPGASATSTTSSPGIAVSAGSSWTSSTRT